MSLRRREGDQPVALVTGAGGFIGRHLCRFLKEKGYWVCALLHTKKSNANDPWDEKLSGSLENISFDSLCRVDAFFHLAGKAHQISTSPLDEEQYFRVNVEGAEAAVKMAEEVGTKQLILFSSLAAAKRENWYGKSKYLSEKTFFSSEIGHVCVLRPAMVYGQGCKGNLPRMIRAVAQGWFPPLPEVGRRSMVHVEDVVKAAWLAATRPEAAGKTYVVTDGHEYNTRQIYAWICEALGKQPSRWTLPLPALRGMAKLGDAMEGLFKRRLMFDSDVLDKLIGDEWYDGGLIRRELDFEPRHHLRDALPEIVEYLRKEQFI